MAAEIPFLPPGEAGQEVMLPADYPLAERIVHNVNVRQAFSDFMWTYVGHPNSLQRDIEKLPAIKGYKHNREVLSAFGDHCVVHVRSIPGLETEPQGYFCVTMDSRGRINQ